MKKIFLSLIIGFVGLASFSSATVLVSHYDTVNFDRGTDINYKAGLCIFTWNNCTNIQVYNSDKTNLLSSNNGCERMICFDEDVILNCNGYSCSIYGPLNYNQNNTYIPGLGSDYTSEQCQQEYSLMPIDSCNSEYCEMNNLCEVIGGSGSSTLYINDIWHESAPFIYVNIPEEFKRDYLTGEQEFTINVEGLNGDADYIQGIIDVNSYRPSSEDFTQTFVGGLTLIFPYIIITAVILFIRRFIRKIFK